MSFEFEARFFCRLLQDAGRAPRRVLIVGCGDGTEAQHIASETGAEVVGLDLDVDGRLARPGLQLLRADGRALPLRERMFDALYCYHVLEHVPFPQRAIAECRRVLAPGAIAFFGTPNKSRLIGYAGGRATTLEKIRWNLNDYGKRLSGRWSNESGAHAGFSGTELMHMLRASFDHVESVSLLYYVGKYPDLRGMWESAFRLGLGRFFAPSVYFRASGDPAAPQQSS